MVEMAGHPEIFGHNGPVCGTCTYAAARLRRPDGRGQEGRAPSGYGVSQNSKDCANATSMSDRARTASDTGGTEVVYTNDSLAFGLPNGIGPEVTAMKEAGVDMVMTCIDLNGMKSLAQELERQGMDDVVLYHPNTYNQDFVAAAGDLFEGDYVGVGFRPFEADDSGSQLAQYHEWMEKSGYPDTELAMVGWINADTAYTGLKAAGPEFDRQKVIDATNPDHRLHRRRARPPIDWTRQHEPPEPGRPGDPRPGDECQALVKIVDGAFQVVGDNAEPWVCWPGDTRVWSEPVSSVRRVTHLREHDGPSAVT